MSGIKVERHKVLVYAIAGMLASVAAIVLSLEEPDRPGRHGRDVRARRHRHGGDRRRVSLSGGRGSIIGTVLGALIFGVIISGFTFLRLDAYYQEMVKGVIIVGAVVLDQWRQRRARRETEEAKPMSGRSSSKTEGLTKHYGGVHALEDCQLRAPQGRARRHHGRQRRRQVDLRAPDHRRRAARPRGKIWFDGQEVDFDGPARGPRGRHRDGVPEPGARRRPRRARQPVPRPREDPASISARSRSSTTRAMREATIAGLKRTGGEDPEHLATPSATCRAASGSAWRSPAPRPSHSKLIIMDEPTAALGVQETAQVENIIRTLKAQGEPLILISHNMRQVFDLVDRIVVFRRGRIVRQPPQGGDRRPGRRRLHHRRQDPGRVRQRGVNRCRPSSHLCAAVDATGAVDPTRLEPR